MWGTRWNYAMVMPTLRNLMAAGPLLVSEPLQRYRALGLAGDPVWRAAGQLRAAIAQRLSRQHADLLAIPEVDPTGPPHRLVRALRRRGAPRRRTRAGRARGGRWTRSIACTAISRGWPRRWRRRTAPSAERNFARLLRHALTAPGEDTLYVVDGRPVMTFWGFSADANLPGVFLASPPVLPQTATAARPVPEAVMVSAPAVAALGTRSAWWQWLLLAILLLLLLAVLAWLVRPYLPHIEPTLEAEARDRALSLAVRQPLELQHARVDTLQQENEDLRLELARLTDELAHRGGDCAAGLLVPGGVVAGVAGAPIERGPADGAGGPDLAAADKGKDDGKGPDDRAGDKTGDKAGDKGDTKGPDGQDKANQDKANQDKGPDQAADKDKPAKDEPKPMVVPPDAKQKQDLAFLKGDWRSRTALGHGDRRAQPASLLHAGRQGQGQGRASCRRTAPNARPRPRRAGTAPSW